MGKKQTNLKNKLLKLRNLLTISEAARRLSIDYGEEITESDVLRFALDGHLTLSVNFLNRVHAKCGLIGPCEGAEWFQHRRSIFDEEMALLPDMDKVDFAKMEEYLNSIPFKDNQLRYDFPDWYFRDLGDEVTIIDGIWDMLMIGNGGINIEDKYQKLTGGPDVVLTIRRGVFVHKPGCFVFQLQENNDYDSDMPGTYASLERIEKHIINHNINEEGSKALLDEHDKAREIYIDNAVYGDPDCYLPAWRLPNDCALGVRPQALIDFNDKLAEEESKDKPLDIRRERSYLTIIGAILEILFNPEYKRKKFSSETQLRGYIEEKFVVLKGTSLRTTADIFIDAKKAADGKWG